MVNKFLQSFLKIMEILRIKKFHKIKMSLKLLKKNQILQKVKIKI
jgi:hypothetical protein